MTSQPPAREGAQPRRMPAQHWTTDLHATPLNVARQTNVRPAPHRQDCPRPRSPILPTLLARFEFGPSQAFLRSRLPHPPIPHLDPERSSHQLVCSQPPRQATKKTLKRGLVYHRVTCCPPANTIRCSSPIVYSEKPAGGPRDLRSTHGARGDGRGPGAREISGWGLGGQADRAQERGGSMRASSLPFSRD